MSPCILHIKPIPRFLIFMTLTALLLSVTGNEEIKVRDGFCSSSIRHTGTCGNTTSCTVTHFSDSLTLVRAFFTYELKLPSLIPYNFSLMFYVCLPSYLFRFPFLIYSCRDPFLSNSCDVMITTSYICSAHSAWKKQRYRK